MTVLGLEVSGPSVFGFKYAFPEVGGTIGAAEDNQIFLPNAQVSAHHAEGVYDSGTYYFIDSSHSGTSINASENRLVRRSRYSLKDGDTVSIGPYHIRVSLRDYPARETD